MAVSKGTSVDYISLLAELDAFLVANHVLTIAINFGGTGYVVGDILTVAGGTTSHVGRIIVTTVAVGVITGARIHDSGAYTVNPGLAANAVTGGSGTTATFNLTMESDPWTVRLSSTIFTTERVRIYSGTGGGGVYVGLRTYQEDTGARQARNWCLFGCSSYNGALPWYQQPDINTDGGFSNATGAMTGAAAEGHYMVLKDNDAFPMSYWFYVTNRRIIVITKLFDGVTTTPRYASCYMGLLNPMGTSAEFPYPPFIAGSSGSSRTAWDDLAPAFQFSGITQLYGITGNTGPGAYYSVDGFWKDVKNSSGTFGGSSRTESNVHTVYPCGQMNVAARPNNNDIVPDVAGALQWENIINMSGNFSTASVAELWPTPDSAGEKRVIVPCVLTISNSVIAADYHIVGELDGVYWTSAAGTVQATSEDLISDAANGNVYSMFANGVYAQLDGFMAIRET